MKVYLCDKTGMVKEVNSDHPVFLGMSDDEILELSLGSFPEDLAGSNYETFINNHLIHMISLDLGAPYPFYTEWITLTFEQIEGYLNIKF